MKIKTLRILFHQKEKLSIFANVGNEYITIWKGIINILRFTKTLRKNFRTQSIENFDSNSLKLLNIKVL